MADVPAFKNDKEKVAYLEKILDDYLGQPKMIGTVVSNCYTQKDKTFARVSANNAEAVLLVPESLVKKLKVKDVVMMIGGAIIDILPSELEIVKAPKQYTLANWSDIGGLGETLNHIRESVELPLKHSSMYKEMGVEPVKGILLFGPPGNGKTLVAKAIAATVLGSSTISDEGAFIYIKGAEILEPLVGVAEQHIVAIFKRSRDFTTKTKKRGVIFIDEAEAILPVRGSRYSSDVFSTIVPTFLSEMDGFESNAPLVILATNHPNSLDPAILREGRMDLKFEIGKPNKEGFKEIVGIHLKTTKCDDKILELAELVVDTVYSTIPERVSGSLASSVVRISSHLAIKRAVDTKCSKSSGIKKEDITKSFALLN